MSDVDFKVDYDSIHYLDRRARSTKKKRPISCSDCKFDQNIKVNGEWKLCQHPSGGNSDLYKCYTDRVVIKGAATLQKRFANDEPKRKRSTKNLGRPKTAREYFGVPVEEISSRCGIPASKLMARMRVRPRASLEELMKPIDEGKRNGRPRLCR